jgi:hypothetical protein
LHGTTLKNAWEISGFKFYLTVLHDQHCYRIKVLVPTLSISKQEIQKAPKMTIKFVCGRLKSFIFAKEGINSDKAISTCTKDTRFIDSNAYPSIHVGFFHLERVLTFCRRLYVKHAKLTCTGK